MKDEPDVTQITIDVKRSVAMAKLDELEAQGFRRVIAVSASPVRSPREG